MASLVLPANYAYVALVATGTLYLNIWQSVLSGQARKAARIIKPRVSECKLTICLYFLFRRLVSSIPFIWPKAALRTKTPRHIGSTVVKEVSQTYQSQHEKLVDFFSFSSCQHLGVCAHLPLRASL